MIKYKAIIVYEGGSYYEYEWKDTKAEAIAIINEKKREYTDIKYTKILECKIN